MFCSSGHSKRSQEFMHACMFSLLQDIFKKLCFWLARTSWYKFMYQTGHICLYSALCVYPHWKAALRNFGQMLPSVPIFPVYNFFRQNIWHSIFDQFHFHHIFGDEMSIIRQDRQQAKALVVHFGDQLNVYLREELQIFEGTAGESTNIYIFQI